MRVLQRRMRVLERGSIIERERKKELIARKKRVYVIQTEVPSV